MSIINMPANVWTIFTAPSEACFPKTFRPGYKPKPIPGCPW